MRGMQNGVELGYFWFHVEPPESAGTGCPGHTTIKTHPVERRKYRSSGQNGQNAVRVR